ncbi:MAG TPA: zinc-dependent metalloprotease [Demequinaceae bacterium]
MSDDSSEWMKLLRELFGDRAEEALDEMRRMGVDPAQLAAAIGVDATPGMLDHMLSQLRDLMAQSAGEDVNWTLAHDVARGVAAQGGDPMVSAAAAADHRAAVSTAELWLDAATDFAPSTLVPRIWSHAEWVEATLPTWRTLAGPVAVSVSRALGALLSHESDAGGALLGQISPTVCGMHVGQAAGAMAREAFGGTDLGLPLLPEPQVALVPRSISEFAEGLDVPADEVRSFLALRECAHVRLFKHSPWLQGQLHVAIERYASGVSIDLDALDEAVHQAGMGDPDTLQKALSKGIFATAHTDDQRTMLEAIETMLALIEGWVDDVTAQAAAPHLRHLGQLREMMRRRRAAGGPAEHTFATLLGLELRPRRLRDAVDLWTALRVAGGTSGRDDPWAHPDLLPGPGDLADWRGWVAARGAVGSDDDVDRELREMLGEGSDGPSGTVSD